MGTGATTPSRPTSESPACVRLTRVAHKLRRQADLVDISQATDIHGTKFDDPSHPIAKKGKLDKSITPGTYVSFVNFIDDTQLARFGVHNGTRSSHVHCV